MYLEIIDDFYSADICQTLAEKLLINTFPWGFLSQSIPTPLQWPTEMLGPEPADHRWPSEIPNGDFMFIHNFFQEVDDLHNQMIKESNEEERDYMVSPCFNIIEPTIPPILEHFGFKQLSLLRVKANLDTIQNQPMKHVPHTDYPIYTYEGKSYFTAVLQVNDNNGATVVNGEKIDQEANRLLVFDGSSEHYGITQTDVSARLVVNYNFMGDL